MSLCTSLLISIHQFISLSPSNYPHLYVYMYACIYLHLVYLNIPIYLYLYISLYLSQNQSTYISTSAYPCIFINQSINLLIYLYIYRDLHSYLYLSICMSNYLSIFISFYLYLSNYLSYYTFLPIHISTPIYRTICIYQCISLHVFLFIFLSIYPSITLYLSLSLCIYIDVISMNLSIDQSINLPDDPVRIPIINLLKPRSRNDHSIRQGKQRTPFRPILHILRHSPTQIPPQRMNFQRPCPHNRMFHLREKPLRLRHKIRRLGKNQISFRISKILLNKFIQQRSRNRFFQDRIEYGFSHG